jgi:ketosteroid isomerase-like protein
MIYRWLVRKAAQTGWQRLSDQRIDDLPLTDDVHFRFLGDHELAVDLRGPAALRAWLGELFARFPRLRFEPEDIIVEGGPWSTRLATRYNATQDGELIYRAVQFARIKWGKLAEETIQPDTQLVAAALVRTERPDPGP